MPTPIASMFKSPCCQEPMRVLAGIQPNATGLLYCPKCLAKYPISAILQGNGKS